MFYNARKKYFGMLIACATFQIGLSLLIVMNAIADGAQGKIEPPEV